MLEAGTYTLDAVLNIMLLKTSTDFIAKSDSACLIVLFKTQC